MLAGGGALLALFFLLPPGVARDGAHEVSGLFAAAAMVRAVQHYGRARPGRGG